MLKGSDDSHHLGTLRSLPQRFVPRVTVYLQVPAMRALCTRPCLVEIPAVGTVQSWGSVSKETGRLAVNVMQVKVAVYDGD